MAPSGPSIIHPLNGLYDANLDHQPVAAIIGQQKRMALGDRFQQELENDTRRRGPESVGRRDRAHAPSRNSKRPAVRGPSERPTRPPALALR